MKFSKIDKLIVPIFIKAIDFFAGSGYNKYEKKSHEVFICLKSYQ